MLKFGWDPKYWGGKVGGNSVLTGWKLLAPLACNTSILLGAHIHTGVQMHNLFLNPHPMNEVFTCLLGSCPWLFQIIWTGGFMADSMNADLL